jgi:phage tail-like protein
MPGQLVQNLPTPFRDDPATHNFLKAFEKVLLGVDDQTTVDTKSFRGLEQLIAQLPTYFDPAQTPEPFLPWLAGWLAFTLRADLDKAKHRQFIAQLPELYKWRGTPRSLLAIVKIFTNRDATITLSPTDPLYFQVMIDFSDLVKGKQQNEFDRVLAIAHALVRREKPAHTFYVLIPVFETFRLGGTVNNVYTPFYAQVGGGVDAAGNAIGNTRLGASAWDK